MALETPTLADALPLEIERCKRLVTIYESLGHVGMFGKLMIEADIKAAEKATQEGDTVGMLRAYAKLKECKE